MNILLCSVGRRPYLVTWFRDALAANGLEGRVIAADLDPLSPSRAFADDFLPAPPVADPGYRDWLGDLLSGRDISLAVSINDFELSEWSHLPLAPEWAPLVRLSAASQRLVEDKYVMSTTFLASGPPAPRTWLGGAIDVARAESRSAGKEPGFVVKGRFGSASRGLRFTDAHGLAAAVASAVTEVTTRQGRPALEQDEINPLDLVIVQERINGPEFGLDVVNDLDGNFTAVLARRKIAMRAGETDRAETVPAERFRAVAERVAQAVGHVGSVDVDVMVDDADPDGVPRVIDVNPRFGGGYPFSHLAGARVPHAYVAWAAGLPVSGEWLLSDAGVVGGKYVDAVAITGRCEEEQHPPPDQRESSGRRRECRRQ